MARGCVCPDALKQAARDPRGCLLRVTKATLAENDLVMKIKNGARFVRFYTRLKDSGRIIVRTSHAKRAALTDQFTIMTKLAARNINLTKTMY